MIKELQTTVVIPVWGIYADQWLEEAVRSLGKQSTRFRLLIVDNASQVPLPPVDGAEVIRAPARVTLGAARNLGLAHVETPFVIFWDADDLMPPETIGFLETKMAQGPELVAFGMAITEASSGQRHRWPRPWIRTLVRFPRTLAFLDSVWSQFPTTGATIIRTDAARAAGGFSDAESGDDWCLGVSLTARGRVGWSERPGRIYRLHPESVWASHFSLRNQLRHAGHVRDRLRRDPGVPTWLQRTVRVVQAAQYAALTTHAVRAGLRRLRG